MPGAKWELEPLKKLFVHPCLKVSLCSRNYCIKLFRLIPEMLCHNEMAWDRLACSLHLSSVSFSDRKRQCFSLTLASQRRGGGNALRLACWQENMVVAVSPWISRSISWDWVLCPSYRHWVGNKFNWMKNYVTKNYDTEVWMIEDYLVLGRYLFYKLRWVVKCMHNHTYT